MAFAGASSFRILQKVVMNGVLHHVDIQGMERLGLPD